MYLYLLFRRRGVGYCISTTAISGNVDFVSWRENREAAAEGVAEDIREEEENRMQVNALTHDSHDIGPLHSLLLISPNIT